MSKKNLILHHATTLFARKGFKETSMAEVSQLSGVASATIFYHFASKEELLLAILKRVKDAIVKNFKHYESHRCFKNGFQAVQGAIAYYLDLAAEMEDEFLLLHRNFLYRLAQDNPVCRRHLEQIYDCLVDIIESAINLGQKDGSVGDVQAHKTALILFSTVDGIARFNTYRLYDAGALYEEVLECCRRILARQPAAVTDNGV
jgi:AcrR family transcriptional regulator